MNDCIFFDCMACEECAGKCAAYISENTEQGREIRDGYERMVNNALEPLRCFMVATRDRIREESNGN